MTTGLWATPGVPHKGWTCVDVEDLGSPTMFCEMCQSQEIRYAHYLSHPNYPNTVTAGCVCAERMEDDYVGPKERQKALVNISKRRKNWLGRAWQNSKKGNDYIRTDGFIVTIFPAPRNRWKASVLNAVNKESAFSPNSYETSDEAKLAGFDAMILLKNNSK